MLTTIREGYFMINDIILGIKDLYKDKILVVFYIIFFSCIMVIIISTSQSIFREVSRNTTVENKTYTDFETFIIGLKPDNSEQLLQNLSSIYQKDSYSFCNLKLNAEGNVKVNTYIIWGDISNKYHYLDSNEDIRVIIGKDLIDIDSIYLNDLKLDVDATLVDSYTFEIDSYLTKFTDDVAFIIIKKPILSDWIDENNHDFIFEIINNTHILSNKHDLISTYLDYVNSDFIEVRENKILIPRSERSFILKRIYPVTLIMLICCFLSITIILDGTINKRTKEFTLYLLHGAKLSNIIIRFLSYYTIIILISIELCIALGITSSNDLVLYLLLGLVITFIFAIIIINKLRNKNLYANLRIGGK